MENHDFVMPWGITKSLIKPMENQHFRSSMSSDSGPCLPQAQMTILRRPCHKNRMSTHSIVLELMILPRTASGPLALCKLERAAADRGIMRNAIFRSYQLWLDYFASSLVCRQQTPGIQRTLGDLQAIGWESLRDTWNLVETGRPR